MKSNPSIKYQASSIIHRLSLMSVAIFSVLLASLSSAAAEDLTVDEIITKANEAAYYAGRDGQADVKMTIVDAGGGERVRQFRILRLNAENGNQKFYVYFNEPADVRRMVYLVWKKVGEGQDDDRWMYLPALDLVRRIAPGDKRTSFVGSDFVYEDVSGRNLNADEHELISSAGGQYQIKNTPKDPGSVEFSYYNVWIDQDTFLPRKAEYYDKNGKLYRRVEGTKVETVQGYPTVVESVVTDLNTGGKTVNAFSGMKYDIGLNDAIFSERFLKRPPREATR
ncbi:MAG TPA: outer membrane lipoprotein-sorting protein [Kiritimatiellia bacterium]|nr:outer membrane lipoprotein-sorting protein [Kiritimatiellia bacterium]